MSAPPVSTAGSTVQLQVGNATVYPTANPIATGNPIAETPRASPSSSTSSILGIVTPKGDSDHSRIQLLNDKKTQKKILQDTALEHAKQKVASLESVRPAGRSLKKGTFLCDGDVLKNFIYVPSGYVAHTARAVECILRELGVPLPEIAFRFDKTFNVAPPLSEEGEANYIEDLRREQYEKRVADGHARGRSKARKDNSKNVSKNSNNNLENCRSKLRRFPEGGNTGNIENCDVSRSKPRSFYASEGFQHRADQIHQNASANVGDESDDQSGCSGSDDDIKDSNDVLPSDNQNKNNAESNSDIKEAKSNTKRTSTTSNLIDSVLPRDTPLPDYLKDLEYEKELAACTAYSGRPPLDCEHTRIIEHRVKTVVEGISSACAQTSAVYLIREAFRGNKLAEIACQSLKPGVTALSITPARWLTFLCDDGGSPGVWIKGTVRDQGGQRRYLENSECDPPKAWDEPCDDEGVIATHTVGLGEEVRSVINISCNFTEDEKKLMSKERRYMVSGGLIPECTHNLIFQSVRDYEEFSSGFSDKFPTGIIVAGGLGRPWDAAMHAMKEGTPLFVLKGTADAAQILADLIELYDRRQIKDVTDPLAIPKCEELCWSAREQVDMMMRNGDAQGIVSENLKPTGGVHTPANTGRVAPHPDYSQQPRTVSDFCQQRLQTYIDSRFPNEPGKTPFSGQKSFLCKKARVVAQDFPEHFNREAAMVIELGSGSVDALQDEITKVTLPPMWA